VKDVGMAQLVYRARQLHRDFELHLSVHCVPV
jgi:hypothetical protein